MKSTFGNADYAAGYEVVSAEVRGMGWISARDKFNIENPVGGVARGGPARMYAEGGFQALVDAQERNAS